MFQMDQLSACQVHYNTHQTMSKLGPSQESRNVAFLTILGFTKLSIAHPNDDVLNQILLCQNCEKHCQHSIT